MYNLIMTVRPALRAVRLAELVRFAYHNDEHGYGSANQAAADTVVGRKRLGGSAGS
jgi:hypothetical protein